MRPMRQITRLALVAVLLLGCVGCDQVSKHLARAHLVGVVGVVLLLLARTDGSLSNKCGH